MHLCAKLKPLLQSVRFKRLFIACYPNHTETGIDTFSEDNSTHFVTECLRRHNDFVSPEGVCMSFSRREFVVGMAATAASIKMAAQAAKSCPFRLAVINDEISPDFDHACYVASHDFGLEWIEIRNLWGKSLTSLTQAQITDALAILKKYNLKVTDLASPLYKIDFPGAPPKSPGKVATGTKEEQLKAQDVMLDRLIELCPIFGTERIRCFDFWRLEDQKPYRQEINDILGKAAEKCGKHGVLLLLENEHECNTATGPEAVATLKAVPNKSFMLNWDAGNSGTFAGDVPYPDDYDALPKNRIGHVHCKNVVRTPENPKQTSEWRPVDIGLVDWVGQFKALKRDGYHHAVSLETHWHGGPGNTPVEINESSTRISMKGLKECLVKAGISC
jgi:sugar phosphate isomerase/epimerase